MAHEESAAAATERVFRILAVLGSICAPFLLWVFTQVIALQTEVAAVKKDVDHVPELIELSLMRMELRSANESLQKALAGHGLADAPAIPMHGGRK